MSENPHRQHNCTLFPFLLADLGLDFHLDRPSMDYIILPLLFHSKPLSLFPLNRIGSNLTKVCVLVPVRRRPIIGQLCDRIEFPLNRFSFAFHCLSITFSFLFHWMDLRFRLLFDFLWIDFCLKPIYI